MKKRIIIYSLSLLAFLTFLYIGLIFIPFSLPNDAIIDIQPGQSLRSVAEALDTKDIIISRYIFLSYAFLTRKTKQIKSGSYKMPERESIYGVFKLLSDPKAGGDIVVTIPEGYTVSDIAEVLDKKGIASKKDFMTTALQYEGYLFPETYYFSPKTPASDIIDSMRDEFKERFPKLYSSEKKDVVIIASMLEREARTSDDMRIIAGIIYKRLKLGLALQIDATVAYGVCYKQFKALQTCQPPRVNLRDNLKIDGPFNTYTRTSLPVAPISNPGDTALNAALDPKSSDFLFYLHTPEGETLFSKTIEEHEEKRAKYLR